MLALQTFTLRAPVSRYSFTAYDKHGFPFSAERATFEIYCEDAQVSRSVMGRAAVEWAKALGLPADRLEWHDEEAVNVYSGKVCGRNVIVSAR